MPIRNPSFKTTIEQTTIENNTTTTVEFDPSTLGLSTTAIADNDEFLIIQSGNFKRIKASAIKTYNPAGSGGSGGTDTNFSNRLLLVSGRGTNNSTNITDSSSYENPLSLVGDTKISTAYNPFNHSDGSIYFDGTDDRITTNNSNFAIGTGNFAFEMWVRWASLPGSGEPGIFQISDTAGGLKAGYANSLGIAASVSGGGHKWFYFANGSYYVSAVTISPNTWYYVVLKRVDNVTSLWVNGTLIASVADSSNYSIQYLCLGGYYNNSFLGNFYLSNFRYSNIDIDASVVPTTDF